MNQFLKQSQTNPWPNPQTIPHIHPQTNPQTIPESFHELIPKPLDIFMLKSIQKPFTNAKFPPIIAFSNRPT